MHQPIPEFVEPRLVAIYDSTNSYEPNTQPDFYSSLARQLGARRVIDLGCGTGLVTLPLVATGREVSGFDPSPLMLEVARGKPGADRVEWVEGGAERLGAPDADLVVMSGHVAQFFLTDESWRDALGQVSKALRIGGCLAFESRNPDARPWDRWKPSRHRTVVDPIHGPIECWTEADDPQDEVVSTVVHRRLRRTGEDLRSPVALRFRGRDELETSLRAAGFSVDSVFGNWDRRPVAPDEPELIFIAVRTS